MSDEQSSSSVETETVTQKPKRTKKPKNQFPNHHPLTIVNRAKERGIEDVLVSFSGGKDSIATLDICVSNFRRVVPFFMYIVKGLSFQEKYLRYIESRYNLEIVRVPDWRLCAMLRNATFRHPTKQAADIPSLKLRDVEHKVREQTGIHWIASGETVFESLQRRGMIQSVGGVCPARGHFYPIGYWRRQDVMSYLSMRDIPLPSDYRVLSAGGSFGGLRMRQVAGVKTHFPDDYAKIVRLFPLVDAQITRFLATYGTDVPLDDEEDDEPSMISDEEMAFENYEEEEHDGEEEGSST